MYTEYLDVCLFRVFLLKTKHPECDIQIVRVLEATDESPEKWYEETFSRTFPRCIPDRNIFSPNLNAQKKRTSSNFIRMNATVEYWMVRQCSHIFVYSYFAMPESGIGKVLDWVERNSEVTMISLGSADTEAFIRERIHTASNERHRTVLEQIADGVAKKEISIQLGVTTNQIDHLEDAGRREIHQALKRRCYFDSKEKAGVCSLIGITKSANATDIVMFKGLLSFLTERYGIHTFWIDRESADSVYGSILAIYCNEHSYPKTEVKVFMACEDEDEESESITRQYCPPFHSVVHVAASDGTRESVCKDVIEHSAFCLTDFTGEQYSVIRELCRKYGKAGLIDISARHLEMDTSFMNGDNT